MGQQEFDDIGVRLEADDAEARAAWEAYQRGLRDGQTERIDPDPELSAKRKIVEAGMKRDMNNYPGIFKKGEGQ